MFASSSSVPGNLRRIVARRFALPLLLSIAALCAVNDAGAQVPTPWTTDTAENDAITTAPNEQKRHEMVCDQVGNTFIVWEDLGDGGRLYIQKIAPNGEFQWAPNGVPVCSVRSAQDNARLISDGVDGVIITWSDNRAGQDIFAQRIRGNGTAAWAAEGVPVCQAIGVQKDPQLTSDGQGGAIITWYDARISTVNTDVFAQRLNDDGAAQWQGDGVPVTNATDNQTHPQIASDHASGAFIVWRDSFDLTDNMKVRRIRPDGSFYWAERSLGGNVWTTPHLVCIPDGAGGVIAAWANNNNNIVTQKVDSAGTLKWGSSALLVLFSTNDHEYPQLLSDGSGGAFVSWDYKQTTSNRDVYLQHISVSKTLWSTPLIFSTPSNTHQTVARLCSDAAGGAIIAWTDGVGSNGDINAQRVDANRNTYWGAYGREICNSGGEQLDVRITAATDGGAIVSWKDYRAGNYDIYASRVSTDGTLGPPPPPASSGPAAPSNVSLVDDGDSLNLTWTDNATNETGYKILRSVNGADPDELAVLDANSTSYSDSDINNCSIYEYTVVAYNNDGNAAAEPVEHDNTMQPTLTLHGDNPATIPYGRTYYDAGATGRDGCNNSLQVSVTQNTVDTSAIGSYTVAYSVTDAHGKTATASRTVSVVKANQTITIATLSDKTYGDAPITLSATSSSGLPVSLAVTGPATLTESVLTLNAAGTVTVTAAQAGNGNYNPAADVVRTFEIHKANASISVIGYNGTYDGQPHTATGTARGIEGTPADLSSLLHIIGTFTEVPGGTATWTFDGNDNYNPSTGSASIIIRAISPVRPKPPVRP